jgi:RNA polymerase sigma-70 factor, ECF subfamily
LAVERSDEQLIHAALRGDGEAFAVVYRRHAPLVTAFVRRRVASPELAFDLTAETFAAAIEHLGQFRAEAGTARAWLLGIAANECRQAWRRGAVEDRARRRLGMERAVLDDDALERVEALASTIDLEAALASLPPAERAAIDAHVVGEVPYDELATALACSNAVVRQRVSRGLRRLRDAMGEA